MTITLKSIPLTSHVEFYPTLSCLKNISSGESVYLTPSEKKLFEIVLEGKGNKENVIHEIWMKNGTIVGESSYHQLIKNLRRKLKLAGLSCSMIKTIPRYGVVFVNYEQDIVLDNKSSENTKIVSHDQISNECDHTEKEIFPTPSEEKNQDNNISIPQKFEPLNKNTSEERDRKTKKNIPLSVALLILTCMLCWPGILLFKIPKQVNSFPLEATLDNVRFHFLTSEQMAQENLNAMRRKLGVDIHDVYIANNGPKVWVAKCNKDISQKDSQCQYEYFSSY